MGQGSISTLPFLFTCLIDSYKKVLKFDKPYEQHREPRREHRANNLERMQQIDRNRNRIKNLFK
jgi:hypothetical protein